MLASIAAPRAPFWLNLGQNAPQSPPRRPTRQEKRITRSPRATFATVATNAFMFTGCSKTVAEVANVALPAGDMPHRLASLTSFAKRAANQRKKTSTRSQTLSRHRKVASLFSKCRPSRNCRKAGRRKSKLIQNMQQRSAAIGVNNRGGWRTKSPASSNKDRGHDPSVSGVPHPPESPSFGISGSSAEIKGARRSCATVHTRSSRTSA